MRLGVLLPSLRTNYTLRATPCSEPAGECAEVAARLHARGSLEVLNAIEDVRSRVDVRRNTLSAVDAQLPPGAVLESDRQFIPVAGGPLDDVPVRRLQPHARVGRHDDRLDDLVVLRFAVLGSERHVVYVRHGAGWEERDGGHGYRDLVIAGGHRPVAPPPGMPDHHALPLDLGFLAGIDDAVRQAGIDAHEGQDTQDRYSETPPQHAVALASRDGELGGLDELGGGDVPITIFVECFTKYAC